MRPVSSQKSRAQCLLDVLKSSQLVDFVSIEAAARPNTMLVLIGPQRRFWSLSGFD